METKKTKRNEIDLKSRDAKRLVGLEVHLDDVKRHWLQKGIGYHQFMIQLEERFDTSYKHYILKQGRKVSLMEL